MKEKIGGTIYIREKPKKINRWHNNRLINAFIIAIITVITTVITTYLLTTFLD